MRPLARDRRRRLAPLAAPRPGRVRARRRRDAVPDAVRRHGEPRGAARRRARRRRARRRPTPRARDRPLGSCGRARRLPRLRGPHGALRPRHLRRLHQARRHGDVPRDARSRRVPRPRPLRTRALDVRGDAAHQPRVRLSGRLVRAARCGATAARDRRGVALAAAPRPAGRAARARALLARGPRRAVQAAARRRRLRRRPARDPLRLLALGRDQGARDRRPPRRPRRMRAAAPGEGRRPRSAPPRRRCGGDRRRPEPWRRPLAGAPPPRPRSRRRPAGSGLRGAGRGRLRRRGHRLRDPADRRRVLVAPALGRLHERQRGTSSGRFASSSSRGSGRTATSAARRTTSRRPTS